MSLLSTKGVYGLICIFEISKGNSSSPVSLQDISNNINVSKNYLEQIINNLRSAGLIASIKGLKGGYYLSRPLSEISYYEIFNLLEKDFGLSRVTLNTPYSLFIKEYDEKLKELFNKPLSSFEAFKQEANAYLNYVI